MPEQKELITLINKYLTGSINKKELKNLEALLEKPENKALFFKSIKQDYNQTSFPEVDSIEALRKLEIKNKTKIHQFQMARVAAVVFILFGFTWAISKFLYPSSKSTLQNSLIKMAELKLENGTIIPLYDQENDTIYAGQTPFAYLENNKLFYFERSSQNSNANHSLKVFPGKRFGLRLSDQTDINLNSETEIQFPASFQGLTTRNTVLKGEAFFDVTHTKEAPFQVFANDVTIQVLGTRFNVNAYQENQSVSTTLEEGSIRVLLNPESPTSKDLLLVPGEQMLWNKAQAKLTKKIVSPADHISWVEGKLVFIDERFEDITSELGRHFNIEINVLSNSLKEERFTAKFNGETINQILNSFQLGEEFDYAYENSTTINIE